MNAEQIKDIARYKKTKYGNNFPCIAKKWTEILGYEITELQVPKMMALMKTCRIDFATEANEVDAIKDSHIDYEVYMWIYENYEEYLKL